MTNKTYTLNDGTGTVLKVGDVYEATPEGFGRMTMHRMALFGFKGADTNWLRDKEGEDGDVNDWLDPTEDDFKKYAPFTIIWLPEQADDNVIPADEVVEWRKQGKAIHYDNPAGGGFVYNKLPIEIPGELMELEWLIAKGVTFYKQKPEGV